MSYEARFARNLGFIAEDDQQILRGSVAAIAGCGGDGGHTALALARLGVGGFHLSDPEDFEIENTNRQAGCLTRTLGSNKAEVIGQTIRDINPDATVRVWADGVQPANVSAFLEGADVLVDETDFTRPDVGVLLARQARERNLTVCLGLNVGFGCLFTSFVPDGVTLERYLGLPDHSAVEVVDVPLWRWAPRIPRYASLDTLRRVQAGQLPAPSVSPGVLLGSAAIATEAMKVLLGETPSVNAPKLLWFDAWEGKARVFRFRRLQWWCSLARLSAGAVREKFRA